MNVTEKSAYLKGLFDGLKIDKESDSGKLFSAIIDAIDEIALNVSDLNDVTDAVSQELDMVEDAIDELDDSIEDIWDAIEGEDEYDDECDGNCDECDEDEDLYQLVCPSCGEEIVIDEEGLEKGVMNCPNCGEELELELEDEEETEE